MDCSVKSIDLLTVSKGSCVTLSWWDLARFPEQLWYDISVGRKKNVIWASKTHLKTGWSNSFKCSEKGTIWLTFGAQPHHDIFRKAQITQGRICPCQDLCNFLRSNFLGCLSGHLNLSWRRTEKVMSLGYDYQSSVFFTLWDLEVPQASLDFNASLRKCFN